ncbi:glycosyltransferase family 4 protein [Natrinema zhouii]|uniref:Glycosyltransferase family 4 protein n=1 Tax=Natrinema zhouii TaxID=1710539 RepID=A0A7D6CSA7_9EURY|nr:glycosyltransferase family 4 protein [Natrinema zhouii]QLK26810.1 glycosyltransferase family 4 protein [Natrinema zhouii]
MKVTYLTSTFWGIPASTFAKFNDVIHYLQVMKNPPFDFEIVSANARHVDSTAKWSLSHSQHEWRPCQLSEYIKKVSEVKSETDVFHLNQADLKLLLPTITAIRSECPLVVGPNISTSHQLAHHRYSPLSRWIDAIEVFTDHHADTLVESGAARRQLIRIPSGARPDLFYPDDCSDVSQSDCTDILFVGDASATYWKGFEIFINAIKKVIAEGRSVEATVVGTPPDDAFWADVPASVESRITLVGHVQRSDLPQFYRSADVLVNPSRNETEGMTSVEARACGTPVIGSDIPPFEKKNTQTFPVGDPDGLSTALCAFLESPLEYKQVARRTANKWSIEQSIGSLADLYGQMR